jgi:hypothetical protein
MSREGEEQKECQLQTDHGRIVEKWKGVAREKSVEISEQEKTEMNGGKNCRGRGRNEFIETRCGESRCFGRGMR